MRGGASLNSAPIPGASRQAPRGGEEILGRPGDFLVGFVVGKGCLGGMYCLANRPGSQALHGHTKSRPRGADAAV
ncbi:hypothetical protein FAZ69_12185 [Trinickia terrae]|uniref:Uncharacterized protein n=1 Tax=Trinickia terrae TaxID=2571161 RepID=A0A4V5PKG3_9BURK|nr:hypothetical protein FAZ69_12185 [Trinickia terrae]